MENSDLIKGIWRKYQRTLISIPGKDGLEKYSTVESESYFSVAAFTEGMKGGLWSGLAGTFTGIGILGTFIGLTIGLAGVDTSSTGALSSSISGLLGGMSTAFVTSIFGIVSAIVFGVWHSQNMKRFGDAVSRFTDALDQKKSCSKSWQKAGRSGQRWNSSAQIWLSLFAIICRMCWISWRRRWIVP